MRPVGHNRAPRIDPGRRDPRVLERRGHDAAVHQLARADDGVVRARRGGTQDAGRLEQRAKIVQLRGYLGEHVAGGLRRQQPLQRLEMTPRELGHAVQDVRVAPHASS